MRCEPWAGCEPSKSMNIGLVELVNLLVGSAHGNYLVALQEKVHKVHKVRGGPRNSDSLLRWDPDQGEGVWNATEATELSC